MQKNTHTGGVDLFWIVSAFVISVADEAIKFILLKMRPESILRNEGALFHFPIPSQLLIILSLLLGIGLFILFIRHLRRRSFTVVFLACILAGALGNFFDRVVVGFTIDYLFLFEQIAFNLSDVLIVIGLIGLFVNDVHKRRLTRAKKLDIL